VRQESRSGLTTSLVYLLDEDLASRSIVGALRDAGLEVTTVPDEFGRGCLDVDWLPEAGQRGWVVLTKDKAMRRSPLELAVLQASRVLAAVPQIEGIVRSRRGRRAILARITAAGEVRVHRTQS